MVATMVFPNGSCAQLPTHQIWWLWPWFPERKSDLGGDLWHYRDRPFLYILSKAEELMCTKLVWPVTNDLTCGHDESFFFSATLRVPAL